jgi:hypothetical protein
MLESGIFNWFIDAEPVVFILFFVLFRILPFSAFFLFDWRIPATLKFLKFLLDLHPLQIFL